MSNKEDGNLYDYSGVCLLITKTLEIEVTKRFLTDYKCYLSSKYKKESDFPKSLQKWNKQKKKMEIIDEEHFTLGEVIHLLGVEYDRDKHHLNGFLHQKKMNSYHIQENVYLIPLALKQIRLKTNSCWIVNL